MGTLSDRNLLSLLLAVAAMACSDVHRDAEGFSSEKQQYSLAVLQYSPVATLQPTTPGSAAGFKQRPLLQK